MEYLLPRIEYDYLGYLLPQKSNMKKSKIVLDGHMPARNDKPVFSLNLILLQPNLFNRKSRIVSSVAVSTL
jgi:hypothetical protein